MPDAAEVLTTVAALTAVYLLRDRVERLVAGGGLRPKGAKLPGKVTRTDLRDRWAFMYGEILAPDQCSSRLHSADRRLGEYLDHLASLPKAPGRTGKLKSRLLRKVHETMTGGLTAGTSPAPPSLAAAATAPATASSVAAPATAPSGGHAPAAAAAPPVPPIAIALNYSSRPQRDAHRAGVPAIPTTILRYRMEAAGAGGAGPAAQKRFVQTTRFVPDVAIRGNYSVKALIDRMFVMLVTRDSVAAHHMKGSLQKRGIVVFADDQMDPHNNIDWKGTFELAPEMSGYGRGRVFAILLQEPTPEKLTMMLRIVDDTWGIVGPVRPFLIEVALDFHARKRLDPTQRLKLREQMVGLLQRHHHCADPGLTSPQADARQHYRDPKGAKPADSVSICIQN